MKLLQKQFKKPHWIILFGSLLLAACSVKPPEVQYFLLEEPSYSVVEQASSVAEEQATERQIALGTLSVADFLAGSGLAVETAEYQLVKTSQHRWAERLDQQLSRQIRVGLAQQYPNIQWIPLAHAGNVRLMDYRLDFQLDSFHITRTQQAEVRIQWFLRTTQDKVVFSGSVQQSQPLTQKGYAHAVAQLNKAWHQALKQLSQEVTAHIQ